MMSLKREQSKGEGSDCNLLTLLSIASYINKKSLGTWYHNH